MTRLFDWRAQRSGASMTIEARNKYGAPVRITGVEVIEAGEPYPRAADKDGVAYELISGIASKTIAGGADASFRFKADAAGDAGEPIIQA